MDLKKLNLIKDTIKANPKLAADLEYIKQETAKNNYEIIINSMSILDLLNDDNILYNYVNSFCSGKFIEKNIINYFNKLSVASGIALIGYKLIEKFLYDNFSNSKELYISESKDKDKTFGLATLTEIVNNSVFVFNMTSKDTKENYLVAMICKTLDIGPDNILDAKVTFSLMRARDGARALSDEIKIKDFTLDWFKNQELDNKLK